MSRVLFFILIGLGGAAILVSLGGWQVQRLAWKEQVITDINARIDAEPVDLPQTPDPDADAYLPVAVNGTFAGGAIRVLVSQKQAGAGYRLITPFVAETGRILVDRGFVPVDAKDPAKTDGDVAIIGNLQWPKETDVFTPAPDIDGNIWFARDVPNMAKALNTRPILVVARQISPDDPVVTPLPVDTSLIPNNHLQYAITWFSLAGVWSIMSYLFVRRRAPVPES